MRVTALPSVSSVFLAPTECGYLTNVSTVKTRAHYVLVEAQEAGNMIGSEARVQSLWAER